MEGGLVTDPYRYDTTSFVKWQAELSALANRLVGILHGCLRSHTRYDGYLAWHTDDQKLNAAA